MLCKIRSLVALCFFVLSAQGPSLAQSVPRGVPANWIGVGAAWSPSSQPQIAGWESYAHVISQSQQIYSFSTHEVVPLRKPFTLQASVRTGVAFMMRQFGPFQVLGLGDAGVAASAADVAGSFSGGGVFLLRIGATNWSVVGVSRVVKGLPHPVYELGIGRSW